MVKGGVVKGGEVKRDVVDTPQTKKKTPHY